MKKKRILIDLSILKNVNCGLGQVALNYGRYFRDNYSSNSDYEIYLLVPKHMVGEFGSEVKYIQVNWLKKYFLSLIPTFDVWHAIHQLSYFGPVNSSTKFILTIHDFNFMYEKSEKKQQRMLIKLKNKIDRADEIVCISEFAKSETHRYLDIQNKPISVIYNAVEELSLGKAIRPQFITTDKPFFFTIGQIKQKKNFHVLLPLMKLFPEKELYIAGQKGTSYADNIQSIITRDSIYNVHLVGEVTNEERVWLYKNCEAFLFPSLFEGFGLPIIEAMYFSKPVFSSKETSLKEIGGDCAFFWDNFEADSMKTIIEDNLKLFYSNPELGQKNLNHARQFSYKKHFVQYMEIYTKWIES